MAVDKIILELQADVKGFKAELGNVRKELDSTQKKVADTGKAATQNFNQVGNSVRELGTAIGVAFGVQQLIQFGKASVKAASDIQETTTKVQQLFGSATNSVLEWSKKSASAFGQSQQQALDAAGTFAIFGRAAGLGGEDLVNFSTQFTELASDLASFNNTTPEEAIMAIGAALRGEAEPIRRYGVLMDEASLKQQALALGIIKTTKDALTPQQKVLAAQALIYQQTSAAQGDFLRTSDGLANQQRILAAEFENIKVTVGEAFVPVINEAISVLNKFLQGIEPQDVRAFIDVIGDLVKIFAAYKIATAAAELANGGLVKSFNTLKVAMATNPFGLLIAGLTSLLTLLPTVTEYFNNEADSVNNLNEELDDSNKKLQEHIDRASLISEVWKKYSESKASLTVAELKSAIQALNEEIENTPEQADISVFTGDKAKIDENISAIEDYTDSQEEAEKIQKQIQTEANKRQGENISKLKEQRTALQSVLNEKLKNIEADGKQLTAFELLNKQLDTAKKLLMEQILTGKNYTNTQQTIYDLTNRLTKAQEDYNNALKMSNITNLETLDIEESKPELIDATAGAYTRYADAIQKTIEKQQQANAIDPTEAQKKALEQANSVATGIGNVASSLGDLFVSIGEMAAQEGQKNAAFQKTLTIFAIQLKLAESIANVIANITKNSTDPLTIAANIISGIAAITTAIAQTSAIVNKAQVPQYADGTAFVGLNGNPKGIDTIPAYLNEGEAVIPTEMNKKYPGLASSWIKGNLDEYIMSNWVAPAIEQQRNKDLANNIAEALKINGMFDDYRLYRSLEKNSSINQSGFHSLAKAINKNNKKRGGYA